ncbi:hypothetical protein UFOVP1288_16 [uncultured Caudovirales phage]|uniref:Uncharacterized protein n=1 Tax=uncultured Caudovirales phage TaxID=2100421 RepID=A0A6J5RP45_9CAUD|nr:hypothetical protein UFOVP1195_16 [uncultured Caudovirales phage]CAB4195448.1 hypothetical protein UFOVP1288_16 [uncultured Caudovirales phage]CAB4204917.1 hypothetical protein UFOVP1409_16 [uncultured Caudovirales phage]
MRLDLRSWVKKALDSSQDRTDVAVEWLVARKDADLRDQLIKLGAQQVVRTYFAAQRASALSMAPGRVAATLDTPEVAERVATRQARQAFWDAYTLFGMTPLRTATKAQLEESAAQREGQARGELRLAKFERAIAARLRNNKCVSDVFTSEELEALVVAQGGPNVRYTV